MLIGMGRSENRGPQYRFALRGKIHGAGYKSLSEFAEQIGVTASRISRVVSGWEWPSPTVEREMAQTLGMTLREFKELL